MRAIVMSFLLFYTLFVVNAKSQPRANTLASRIIGVGNILGGDGGSVLGGNSGNSVNYGAGGASYTNDEGILSNLGVLNVGAVNGIDILNNKRSSSQKRILGVGNILGGNDGSVMGGSAGDSINSCIGPSYTNDEGILSNANLITINALNDVSLLNTNDKPIDVIASKRIIGAGNILGGNGGSVLGGNSGSSINNSAGGPSYTNDEGILSNVGVLNVGALNGVSALNGRSFDKEVIDLEVTIEEAEMNLKQLKKRIIAIGNVLGGNDGSVMGGNSGNSVNNGAGGASYTNDEGILSNLGVLNVGALNGVDALNSGI
ncbi:hypothetical protein AKO1_001858 [Acrasis kona]|uniref:Uncharacterized protein n=1 Tax=Acrasis kona TaxID=1008807 RepID=A0AAW2YQ10_9EUKA